MYAYAVVAYQHNGQLLCQPCAALMADQIAGETAGTDEPLTRTDVLEDTEYFGVMFASEASDLNENITCDRCDGVMWEAEEEEEEEEEAEEDWPEQAFDDCPMCLDDTPSYGKSGGMACYRCRQCGWTWQVY